MAIHLNDKSNDDKNYNCSKAATLRRKCPPCFLGAVHCRRAWETGETKYAVYSPKASLTKY
jgi:hypothetical protein